MDEVSIVGRGYRAREWLGHADIQQAVADARAELFFEWTQARTEAERESLHAVSRALDRITGKFQAWADELTRRNL